MNITETVAGEKVHKQTTDNPNGSDWWMLAVLSACYIFYGLDRSLFAVLIEPIKQEFHLSDSQLGLMTGLASSLPFSIVCIPMGMLADRVVRRNLLSLLVGAWSLVTGVTYFAQSVLFLFLSRVGIGTFEAGFSSTSLSLLSDTFPQRLRSTVLGLFGLGTPAGLFLGMSLGGYIDAHHGWRVAFLMAGLPGLILALMLRFTTREPVRGRYDSPTEEPAPPGGLIGIFRTIWHRPALFHIIVGMTWCGGMIATFAVWTPSMLRRTFDLGPTEAGVYAGIVAGVFGTIGAVLGGVLADRMGRRILIRKLLPPIYGSAGGVVCGLVALLGQLDLMPTLVLLSLAAALCQFYLGTGYGLIATLAGPGMRATTLAVQLVGSNLISYTLGSYVVGKVSDLLAPSYGTMSLRYAFATGLVFCLLGIAHLLRMYQLLRRDPAFTTDMTTA